jgi:Ca-activated chloride channel family protein
MIFKAPEMLLLLALLPFLGKLLARARRLKNQTAAKLRGRKGRVSNGHRKQMALPLGSFASLILALAQPAWNPQPSPAGMQGRDLVIALDISRSMLAQDVFPSRLGSAKIALFESLDHLNNQRVGLITFAGAASVRVPLTLDHNFVRYMLERAQPSDADIGSTSIQSAIEKAIDVVLKESEKGKQDVILLTDGEDLLSDIEKTAEELRDCGARVLIIGIGDPVAGARIPVFAKTSAVKSDRTQTNAWMQYEGEDVITKLDEAKLNLLAAESPNVSYVSVQTRPFDLITIYHNMLADTEGISGTESGQMVYTEGYPGLIALALILFLLPFSRRILPALTALLIASCSPDFETLGNNYEQHIEQGRTIWAEAQTPIDTDPRAALPVLTAAREAFLHAAMIRPSDEPAAQLIAGVCAQIRAVEQKIREQEQAEAPLQAKLQAALAELTVLTERETTLSQQSQQLLRKRPIASPEELASTAPPAVAEQVDIGEGTGRVLGVIQEVQALSQNMLAAAYGDDKVPLPTEFDEAVDKLTQARMSQTDAIEKLKPQALRWPQANSSLLTAARRMQEAVASLAEQNKGDGSDQPSEEGDESEWEFEEDSEWSESDMPADMSMPMSSLNFKSALENQSLPSPNYTAEEILAEEAANMEKRAEQKASQAGANVEKNW